jgi:hypothetical protein
MVQLFFFLLPFSLLPPSSYTNGTGSGWGCDEVGMSGRRPSCGAAAYYRVRARAATLHGGAEGGASRGGQYFKCPSARKVHSITDFLPIEMLSSLVTTKKPPACARFILIL